MDMGFSSNAVTSVQNNRRLQHTPARTHWDPARLDARQSPADAVPDRRWEPAAERRGDDVRVGQVMVLWFVLGLAAWLLYRYG